MSDKQNNGEDREDRGWRETEGVERMLGAVLGLMAAHAAYANTPLRQLHARILPPLALQQFFIARHREDGRAMGFISWAKVTAETAAELESGERRLKPSEWNGGEVGVVMDVVAPSGKASRILVERVKREIFPHSQLMARRADAKTKKTTWAEVPAVSADD